MLATLTFKTANEFAPFPVAYCLFIQDQTESIAFIRPAVADSEFFDNGDDARENLTLRQENILIITTEG